jgi:hypothetical protein
MPVRVPKSSFDEDIGLKKPSFLVEDIKIMFTRLLAPANGQNFQWDFTFIRLNFICVAARKQVDATLQTRFVHTATKMSMSPLENKVIKSGWNLKSLATIAYKVLLAIATAASMDTPQRKIIQMNFAGLDALSTHIEEVLNTASSDFIVAYDNHITSLHDLMKNYHLP